MYRPAKSSSTEMINIIFRSFMTIGFGRAINVLNSYRSINNKYTVLLIFLLHGTIFILMFKKGEREKKGGG